MRDRMKSGSDDSIVKLSIFPQGADVGCDFVVWDFFHLRFINVYDSFSGITSGTRFCMTFLETLAVVGFPSNTSCRLETGAKRDDSPLSKVTTTVFPLVLSLMFPTFSYGIFTPHLLRKVVSRI